MSDCCKEEISTSGEVIKKTIRTEEEKKLLINRINRITGQLNGIKNMINEDRYCDDILIQLSAVNSAVKSMANHIIERHLNTCVMDSIKSGNYDFIDEIVELFRRFQ